MEIRERFALSFGCSMVYWSCAERRRTKALFCKWDGIDILLQVNL